MKWRRASLERKHPGLPMAQEKWNDESLSISGMNSIIHFSLRWPVEGLTPFLAAIRAMRNFVSHIKEVVESSSSTSRWHFVADNSISINQSPSWGMCRSIWLDIDLGIKGKSGFLQSIETRESFLVDPSILSSFTTTPIHAFWMNQVNLV